MLRSVRMYAFMFLINMPLKNKNTYLNHAIMFVHFEISKLSKKQITKDRRGIFYHKIAFDNGTQCPAFKYEWMIKWGLNNL